jgi:hypothetical protein
LSEDAELYLDRLKQTIRDKSGVRLSRSELIRGAIRYVITLNPDLSSIKDENDLLEALKNASKK